MHHIQNKQHRLLNNAIATGITVGGLLLSTHAAAAGGVTAANTIMDTIITWVSSIGLGYMTLMIIWTGYKCTAGGAHIKDYGNLLLGAILIGGASAIAALFFGGA
jgi:type IV secretion system protein VirB2